MQNAYLLMHSVLKVTDEPLLLPPSPPLFPRSCTPRSCPSHHTQAVYSSLPTRSSCLPLCQLPLLGFNLIPYGPCPSHSIYH